MPDSEVGRRRRYCRQSCRQRAYEHRSTLRGTSIAAEDVATALREGAEREELLSLRIGLVTLAREAERLRQPRSSKGWHYAPSHLWW